MSIKFISWGRTGLVHNAQYYNNTHSSYVYVDEDPILLPTLGQSTQPPSLPNLSSVAMLIYQDNDIVLLWCCVHV